MNKFTEAAELIDAENRMKKTMWGQFWSAHQRFFKYLCIASKVKHAVEVARLAPNFKISIYERNVHFLYTLAELYSL